VDQSRWPGSARLATAAAVIRESILEVSETAWAQPPGYGRHDIDGDMRADLAWVVRVG